VQMTDRQCLGEGKGGRTVCPIIAQTFIRACTMVVFGSIVWLRVVIVNQAYPSRICKTATCLGRKFSISLIHSPHARYLWQHMPLGRKHGATEWQTPLGVSAARLSD
jgi:hypothetical protein